MHGGGRASLEALTRLARERTAHLHRNTANIDLRADAAKLKYGHRHILLTVLRVVLGSKLELKLILPNNCLHIFTGINYKGVYK